MHNNAESYTGREQAQLKHKILEAYLQRLFMIVGQHKASVINYVDCFAGPWQSEDEDLADTSIGISLMQISSCAESLQRSFNRNVKFRALYIERNPESFQRLQRFLNNRNDNGMETKALFGDYTSRTDEILAWCGPHFTFFFVDPTGFKDVIGARTMLPLLLKSDSEFLINFMYDFVNRFIEVEEHMQTWLELLGEIPDVKGLDSEQRKEALLHTYAHSLKKNCQGQARVSKVLIQKPGKDRPLYYLVYLTRSATGIKVFKEESEKLEIVQRAQQRRLKVQYRSDKTQVQDMFALEKDETMTSRIVDKKDDAKRYLLRKLSTNPIAITLELWADILEETPYFPGELQAAMKELCSEGLVENLDADIGRRYKNPIRPASFGKSERWKLAGKN